MSNMIFRLMILNAILILITFTANASAKDLEIKTNAGVFTQHTNDNIFPVSFINPFAPGLTFPGSNAIDLKTANSDIFSPTIIPRVTGMVVPTIVQITLKNNLGSEITGNLTVKVQTIRNGEKISDSELSEMGNLNQPIISSNLILSANSNQNYLYYSQLWIPDYIEKTEKSSFTYILRTVFALNDGRVIARDTIELRSYNPNAVHCIVLDDLDIETDKILSVPGLQTFSDIPAGTGVLSPKNSKLIWHRYNTHVLANGSSNLETIWSIVLKQTTWDKLTVVNRQVLRDYVNNGGLVFIVGSGSEGIPEIYHGSLVKVASTIEIKLKLSKFHQDLMNYLYTPNNPYKIPIQQDPNNSNLLLYSPPTNPELNIAHLALIKDQRFLAPIGIRSSNLYNITENQLHPLWVARRICRSQANLSWVYGEDGNQVRTNSREILPDKPGNWLANWADYLTNKTQIKVEQQAQNLRLALSSLILTIVLLLVPSQHYRVVLSIGIAVLAILVNAPIRPVTIQDNFKLFTYISSPFTHKSADFQIAEVYTNKSELALNSLLNPSITSEEIRWEHPPRVAAEQVYFRKNEDFIDYRLTSGSININRLQDSSLMFRISQVGSGNHRMLVVSGTKVVDDAMLVFQGRSYPLGRLVPERPIIIAIPENLSRRIILNKYSTKLIEARTALWDYDNIWTPIKGQVYREKSLNFPSICNTTLENIQPHNNELPGLRNFYQAFGLAQWQTGVLPSEFDPNIPLIIWSMQDMPSWMKSSSDKTSVNHNNILFIGITQVKLPENLHNENSENN